jgi:hypothetical protein
MWMFADCEKILKEKKRPFVSPGFKCFVSVSHFRGLIRRPPRVLLEIGDDGTDDPLIDKKEVPPP